ncbi:ABC transporter ATP-binding protein [Rubinisphaera italica]|nr:ATP-binding cassette domain-containing protein [Rubinisphaera italica]
MSNSSTTTRSSTASEFAIQISDLVYQTSHRQFELVIDHFEMPNCSTLAVTGRSGSGKTTLLSLITGQVSPVQGTIEVLNRDLTSLTGAQIRRFRLENIGIVFQDFRLIDYLTVYDNIGVARNLGRIQSSVNVKSRIHQLAEQFGIEKLLDRYPRQISQGEKQRTAIARAMFTKPALILADEPTGNLDPQNANTVVNLLLDAVRENQSSLIVVTHDHPLRDRFDHHVDMSQITGKASLTQSS